MIVVKGQILNLGGLKILLVDDNRHIRLVMRDILRAVNIRDVFEAGDGAEGLELLKKIEVDIVITDLSMRPMNGVEFVRALRLDKENPNPFVPVIMMTGHATAKRVAAARDAGVNEFVVKPITGRNVLDRIRRVIDANSIFVRSRDYFGPDRRRREDAAETAPKRRASDQHLI